jgi:hypothetical protein
MVVPRPPVKATQRLAEAQEYGKLKAQERMRKIKHKFTLESIMLSAREHIGKLIDTSNLKDIIDLVAAVGLTVVIHETIKVFEKVATNVDNIASYVGWMNNPVMKTLFMPTGFILTLLYGDIPAKGQTTVPQAQALSLTDVITWMLSFSLAWCIVKWGDKLLNAGLGSLGGILGMVGLA